MREVEVSADGVEPPHWMPDLGSLATRVLTEVGRSEWEIAVLLCDEDRIASLNREYRQINAPTDVLTFPSDDGGSEHDPVSGDVAIAVPVILSNAREFGVPEREEFIRVYVHALLHLLGYTHDGYDLSSADLEHHPMLGLQERLVAAIEKELGS